MDPISVAALAALAGGVSGEAGKQAWTALRALVRRPFRGRGAEGATAPSTVSSGESELAALTLRPSDPVRARQLSDALTARATHDADFREGLERWWTTAESAVAAGDVHNSVSGGTQHGPVVQGRDFSNITFTTPPPPGPANE